MLHLTRLTGQAFALNPDLIERAESTPDTVVTLVNGSKYVIRESLDELVDCVRAWRAELVAASRSGSASPSAAPVTPRARVAARNAAAAVATANEVADAATATATVVPLRAEQGEF